MKLRDPSTGQFKKGQSIIDRLKLYEANSLKLQFKYAKEIQDVKNAISERKRIASSNTRM
jgi:hypothetical protein